MTGFLGFGGDPARRVLRDQTPAEADRQSLVQLVEPNSGTVLYSLRRNPGSIQTVLLTYGIPGAANRVELARFFPAANMRPGVQSAISIGTDGQVGYVQNLPDGSAVERRGDVSQLFLELTRTGVTGHLIVGGNAEPVLGPGLDQLVVQPNCVILRGGDRIYVGMNHNTPGLRGISRVMAGGQGYRLIVPESAANNPVLEVRIR